jgi:hypothetical protein
MWFALPDAPPDKLREALFTAEGLRRWWHPDTELNDGVLSPGIDAGGMVLHREGWTGDLVRVRFDVIRREVEIVAAQLPYPERRELSLSWQVASATLGWALERRGPITWECVEVPVALAYSDAWTRLAAAEGLGSLAEGARGTLKIAGARVLVRARVVRPPRAIVLELDGALLRVALGPGDSVNAARADLLTTRPGVLPSDWRDWLTHRLGMSWEAQIER